jgi:hypothetical protein
MPICSVSKGNKHCRVEDAIRTHAPALIAMIKPALLKNDDLTPSADDKQLWRAVTVFEEVIAGKQNDLNHRTCRSCGDCLMALEAKGTATHALSSNSKEWGRLAGATGMEFIPTSFADERTS